MFVTLYTLCVYFYALLKITFEQHVVQPMLNIAASSNANQLKVLPQNELQSQLTIGRLDCTVGKNERRAIVFLHFG